MGREWVVGAKKEKGSRMIERDRGAGPMKMRV